jgi:hypothetical protein
MLQLNVFSLGWVIDSKTFRSVPLFPCHFLNLLTTGTAGEKPHTVPALAPVPLDRSSGTGSRRWSGPGVRTGYRLEPVPAVCP